MNPVNGGDFKPEIEPATKRSDVSLQEYLDFEEKTIKPKPFQYSDFIKQVLNQVYLGVYYFVRENTERTHVFASLLNELIIELESAFKKGKYADPELPIELTNLLKELK